MSGTKNAALSFWKQQEQEAAPAGPQRARSATAGRPGSFVPPPGSPPIPIKPAISLRAPLVVASPPIPRKPGKEVVQPDTAPPSSSLVKDPHPQASLKKNKMKLSFPSISLRGSHRSKTNTDSCIISPPASPSAPRPLDDKSSQTSSPLIERSNTPVNESETVVTRLSDQGTQNSENVEVLQTPHEEPSSSTEEGAITLAPFVSEEPKAPPFMSKDQR